jgi:hypothetical protein
MQVNLNTSPNLSVRGLESPPVAREPKGPSDQAVFNSAAALDRALAEVPEVRAENVQRAKDLFTSVQYPPVQMISRISRLVAVQWNAAD